MRCPTGTTGILYLFFLRHAAIALFRAFGEFFEAVLPHRAASQNTKGFKALKGQREKLLSNPASEDGYREQHHADTRQAHPPVVIVED